MAFVQLWYALSFYIRECIWWIWSASAAASSLLPPFFEKYISVEEKLYYIFYINVSYFYTIYRHRYASAFCLVCKILKSMFVQLSYALSFYIREWNILLWCISIKNALVSLRPGCKLSKWANSEQVVLLFY